MKNKFNLILDTNVFINAINGNKNANIILALIDNNKAKLYFSRDTIGELFYITHNICKYEIRDKRKSKSIMSTLTNTYLKSTNINTRNSDGSPKCKDVDDDMFLQCAYISKPDYLISDDLKSGMHGVKLENTEIVTIDEFIEIIIK